MIQQRPLGVARILGQMLQKAGTDLGARGLLIREDVEDDVHDLPAEFRTRMLERTLDWSSGLPSWTHES